MRIRRKIYCLRLGMMFCFIHCNHCQLQSLRRGMWTVSFRIALDDLFDCGAHHITTMKGQVIVNRNVKDENSSKNRIGFNGLPFSIILRKRLSIILRYFKTNSKICHQPMVLMFCPIARAGDS